MKIGYIGLGKMGSSMVLRLLEAGHDIVAYDPAREALEAVVRAGATGAASPAELVQKLEGKRTIWLMVPHSVVDSVVDELGDVLDVGDLIIDGGNSNFKDTVRRAGAMKEKGIEYMDVGTSGGPSGARDGACLMIGGEQSTFDRLEDLFKDIAAPDAYGLMGPVGTGHYVKMVHNGIEYGMMQAIGEGFGLMKESEHTIDLLEVARVYNNRSVIESRLVGWLHKAYTEEGVELEKISGTVAHSGEGLWTVQTAHDTGVDVPVIDASLKFREDSVQKPGYIGQVVSALRNQFGGHEVKKK